MSEIKSSNVSWNNIKVDQYVDITTGYTYLTLPGQTTKLAESSDANWTILDINLFTRTYNNANSTALTNEEVRTLFFRSGRFVFNKIRADIINDLDNYSSVTEFNQNTLGMFNRGVPGSVNPNDGRRVNDNGQKTEFNVVNRNVRTPSTFQVRTQGSPVIPSSFQGPNQLQLASTGNENTYKRSSSGGTMRYPSAQLQGRDYISITAHKYSARGFGNNLTGGSADNRLGGRLGEVQLPMQPNIQEANGVTWGGDKLNEIYASLAEGAMAGMDGALKKGESIGGRIRGAASGIMGGLTDAADKVINDEGSKNFIKAYFAGEAIGANITARATGQVINPNLELLFQGPELRTFNFNFTMTPRDEGEADSIKEIIKFFKKHMAPQKSGQSLFLYTPDVFKLKYMYNGGQEHPYLNRIKPCALRNFSANYTPGSFYSTYEGGSMTQYTMSLTFGELEPIYKEDQNTAGGTGF